MDTLAIPINPFIPISALIHDTAYLKDPIAYVKQQVNNALNGLVRRGALQRCN